MLLINMPVETRGFNRRKHAVFILENVFKLIRLQFQRRKWYFKQAESVDCSNDDYNDLDADEDNDERFSGC